MKDYAIIVVGYDLGRTIYSLGAFGLLADSLGIQERVLVWNGDQECQTSFSLFAASWSLHLGSNLNHEFSGWQEGLAFLSKTLNDYRYVLFANDTFARHDSDARKFLLLPKLALAITSSRLYDGVGLVHDHSTLGLSGDLGQYHVANWICTGCFALSGSVLCRLMGVVDYSSVCSEYISDSDDDIILNNKASKALQEYIDWWLADAVNGWYRAIARPRTADEISFLRKKSLMILDEMMLSIKIKEVGGDLHDPAALYSGSNAMQTLMRLPFRIIKRLGKLIPVA
jgi:hypothetical protein